MGAPGKGAEMGILESGEVGKAARGIGGVHLQTIENVCLLLKRQNCHKLELAEEEPRIQNTYGHVQDGFAV